MAGSLKQGPDAAVHVVSTAEALSGQVISPFQSAEGCSPQNGATHSEGAPSTSTDLGVAFSHTNAQGLISWMILDSVQFILTTTA